MKEVKLLATMTFIPPKSSIFVFTKLIEEMLLDFEIDKLTHSLEDASTGDILLTKVLPVEKADLKFISKKSGWKFNWKTEYIAIEKQIFKLILQQQPDEIQGLICFEKKSDHVFMHLIETAPHNFGKSKKYFGVMANLIAFCCKVSYENGFDGELGFEAKTKLISHYIKELGAIHFGGQRMVILKEAAINLITIYYPDFFNK